jgi:transcriptional regulator with XRE-family HTH domain
LIGGRPPATGRKTLTPRQVEGIKKLRAEVDDWGEPKWTQEYIAEAFGVSSSTVWRVLNAKAGYVLTKEQKRVKQLDAGWAALEREAFGPAEKIDPQLEAAAAASQERLIKMLEKQNAGLQCTDEVLERARAYGAGEVK